MNDKFCVNCKWCLPWFGDSSLNECVHPKSIYVDVVDGKSKLICCDSMRGFGDRCGPSGKLFEPKPQRMSLWRLLKNKFRIL